MKVMTLHQPYATLIALGIKSIETRAFKTMMRGRIAIHAAMREPVQLPDAARPMVVGPSVNGSNRALWMDGLLGEGPDVVLPLGVIVATADLVDCIPMFDHDPKRSSSGYPRDYIVDLPEEGRFAAGWWLLGPSHGGPRLVNDQVPYGDFQPGRWAWILDDIEPLDEPVPFKGGQGWSRDWSPPA